MPARFFSKAIRTTASVLLMSLLAWPAFGATISGTVFEDRNYGGGAGRSLAASGGVGVENARVELYSGNTLAAAVNTNASGQYSFTYSGGGARSIRVVNGTVRSRRTGGAGCTTCVAVQTFRAEAPSGTVVAVTNEVGGINPAVSDPTSTATRRQSAVGSAVREPGRSKQRRFNRHRHRLRFQLRHDREHARCDELRADRCDVIPVREACGNSSSTRMRSVMRAHSRNRAAGRPTV